MGRHKEKVEEVEEEEVTAALTPEPTEILTSTLAFNESAPLTSKIKVGELQYIGTIKITHPQELLFVLVCAIWVWEP